MRSSDYLFRLIKALSKGDRRNFKLFAQLQDGDKQYIKLFDAIDRQSEYDEEKLLKQFDKLNRWLFASYSPLNWFTRRRYMRIQQRRPSEHEGRYRHQRLYNGSGIGRVFFDETGAPERIQILSTRDECIEFNQGYDSDWMD